MKRKNIIALLSGWLALAAGPADAQTAATGSTKPAAPAQTSSTTAPVVKMSPFEVSSDQDVGYQGGNTTSGSRLNTSLKDTPAAIQVVTKEFMEDFGMNSLAEISAYTSNLRPDFRETVPDANPVGVASAGLYIAESRIVIRGLPSFAATDFFRSIYPMDSYNIERFEVASGPNSILFGFGTPGGLINSTTKRAMLDRNRTGVRVRFGSWDFQRYEVDHNQMFKKDKLAFRLNGLFEDRNGWMTNDFKTVKRGAASVRFKPWKRTTIIANGEVGKIEEHVSNISGTIDDQVSLWANVGGPVTDDSAWTTADRARGVNRNAQVQNIFVTNADGSAPYFIPTRNAAGGRLLVSTFDNFNDPVSNAPGVGRGGRTIVHPDEIPMKYSLYGPGSFAFRDIDRLMITVEQELAQDVVLNLAYDRQNSFGESHKPTGAQFYLQGDPNLTIPNPEGVGPAIPNPNAGKLFVESNWNPLVNDFEQEIFRASLSTKFDLGKFGRHNLAGMYEDHAQHSFGRQERVIFVNDNNVPINNANAPENVGNWIRQRHYVTPGDFTTYYAPDGLVPLTITKNGVNYHSRRVNQGLGPNEIEESIKSAMLVTQSYFFDDKLVVTAGIRRDRINFDIHEQGRYAATDPEVVSGERIVNELRFLPTIGETVSLNTTTHTLGGVFHLTPKFSVFYNTSNNNAAPSSNSIILPDKTLPPPSDGETFDYGFMLNLLDGRFFLRATAYETSQTNKAEAILFQGFRVPILRILDALLADGLITEAEREEHSFGETSPPIIRGLNDEVSSGYELSAWYNPTKNFTAQLNFSYTKTDRSNIAPEFEGWFERERAFWFSSGPGAGSLTDPETGQTIDQNVATIERVVQDQRNLNDFGWGIRPYKANVSGRYSFSEGRLKGVFVGGGVRWQDSAPIYRPILDIDADGNPTYGEIIEGAEMFTTDAFVGYRTKINIGKRERNLTVQLNVTNLTDEGDWRTSRFNSNLTGLRFIQPVTPREFRLTASLNF
jgi:outer membrane receptor protein involved in Fe transport